MRGGERESESHYLEKQFLRTTYLHMTLVHRRYTVKVRTIAGYEYTK
jgi:hypothetical protein